jgi:hypothetical protein
MFKKIDGQVPETFSTNIAENHQQLPPTGKDQNEAKLTEAEQNNRLATHKSTGPRSKIGKKTSSQNATKFGIFSKSTLLKGESRSQYDSLREKLWESKQPGDGTRNSYWK